MPTMLVTPLPTVRTKITIYEPRQTPEQEEVVLDEFELNPDETREVDMRSATVGFRQEPVPGGVTLDTLNPAPVPDQEPREGVSPQTDEEMSVGRERADLAAQPNAPSNEAAMRERERRTAYATRTREQEEAQRQPEPKHRPKGDKARKAAREEEAQRLTQGQAAEDAPNPSPATGTTGHADAQQESSAAGSQTPEAVAKNKESTKRSQ